MSTAEFAAAASRAAETFLHRDTLIQQGKPAEAEGHGIFALLLMGEVMDMGAAEVAATMSNEQFEAFAHACRLEHGENISADYIHAKALETCSLRQLGGGQ